NGSGNLVWMSTSGDGGLTWATPVTPVGPSHGLAAEQLVQPNGTVVVPFWSDSTNEIQAFLSSDGGATWNVPMVAAKISDRPAAGGLRDDTLPSVAMESAGNIYDVWQTRRCRANWSATA